MSIAPAAASTSSGSSTPKKPGRFRRYLDDPNPILLKELRSVFRTPLFIRFLYLCTAGVAVLVMMVGGVASSEMPPAEAGQVVFHLFFGVALAVLCLVAPAYSATSLTSEREQGTYESLILSGMDPAKIVQGKFLASFAMFTLVLVALSPVVGIAFLFGGVSPLEVVFAFIGLEMVLACAVAFGLVLSARLRSTRIAILLAAMLFVPASMFSVGVMSAFGQVAQRAWSLNMNGPFWFTEALANRFFELDTFLLVGVLPIFLTAMFVWLCLASAIAGVRPPAEDRSTPFKLWASVAMIGQAIIVGGIMYLIPASDASEAGAAFQIGMGGTAFFIALLFANEPPLAPRIWELRQQERGPIGKIWGVVGPGAAPTLRAAAAIIVLGAMLGTLATLTGTVWGSAGTFVADDYWLGVVLIGIGNAVVCLFALAFAMWLRVILRSGVAARTLTLVVFMALTILPLLGVVIVATRGFSGSDVPALMLISPIAHMLVGVNFIDKMGRGAGQLVVPLVFYGLGALAFWALVEARVRTVRATVEETRKRQQERADQAAAARAQELEQNSPEEVAQALLNVGADPDAVAGLTDSIPPGAPEVSAAETSAPTAADDTPGAAPQAERAESHEPDTADDEQEPPPA